MKNGFSSLITLLLLSIFAGLLIFTFEVKAIKSENIKNEYLQIQAKLHMDFLNDISKTLNDETIKTLEFNDDVFRLKIEVLENTIELYVSSVHHNVSLHTTVIR